MLSTCKRDVVVGVNGEPCAIMPPIAYGFCEDYQTCDCSIQVTGPQEGERLTVGDYTIVVTASNSFNFESSQPCEISVHVR